MKLAIICIVGAGIARISHVYAPQPLDIILPLLTLGAVLGYFIYDIAYYFKHRGNTNGLRSDKK